MAAPDTELVSRVLRDDHDAFEEIVRRYQSPLRSWLRRLTSGDFARADDLAQETFLKAYRRLSSFRGTGKFSTWLFGIAYNEFRTDLRRGRDFVDLNHEIMATLMVVETEGGISGALDLNEGLESLPTEQRAAITLCFQQGMTHEEAAAVLKCPLGTLKTNILRGKERLRRFFHATATVP